jgi:hypothetical protein
LFNKTFIDWQPDVKADISSVKLELTKLNTFFNREAKDLDPSKEGILKGGSAPEQSPFASTIDGSNGHHVDQHYRDCGFGSVYTHTHDPVKGMMHQPPPISNSSLHTKFTPRHESHRFSSLGNQGSKHLTGKLPKMNFPKFEGENPKLWKSHSESYFDMYVVDISL